MLQHSQLQFLIRLILKVLHVITVKHTLQRLEELLKGILISGMLVRSITFFLMHDELTLKETDDTFM